MFLRILWLWVWMFWRRPISGRGIRRPERILMVMGVLDGETTRRVAADLHCPQPNVVYWKRRFEEEGFRWVEG